METPLSTEKIKESIKVLLKRRGYTYSDLANYLDCSLPTAKRILNQEEMGLTRLVNILEWLDVTLGDLHKLVEEERNKQITYTDEQDRFLAENPHYVSYYYKLRHMTPEQIAKEYQLSKLGTSKYLVKLEQLGMIQVNKKGKVSIPANAPTMFTPRGKMVKRFFDSILDTANNFFKSYVKDAIYGQPNKGVESAKSGIYFHTLRATPETFNLYKERFDKVFRDFVLATESEEKIKDEKDLKYGVAFLGLAILDKPTEEYRRFDEPFGDIVDF